MSEQEVSARPTDSELLARGVRLNRWLFAVVAAEAAALIAATAWLITEMVVTSADSVKTAIALIVLTGLVAVWVSATAVGLVRRARWARGSAITWQVLQAAVAFGASQGDRPVWWLTALLIVPAVAVVLLAVSKPIRALYLPDE